MQLLKDRNVRIEIIFGSFHSKYYDDYCDRLGLDYSSLTFWSTHWLPWTSICLQSVIDYTKYQPNTDFRNATVGEVYRDYFRYIKNKTTK